ncbi:MAG: hypothetical protein CSYNP_04169 [Syntrophus sp. SKADARSKE-3]|nr:hypothetical protein [Syntrophus sp. SKADARSKE-3]
MEPELLHILQHSLGLDQYGNGRQYRNHYVAGSGAVENCCALVEAGYMKEYHPSTLSGGDPVFTVTRKGIDAVSLESPIPPKLTRGQRRYKAYLSSECDETFGEWLKNPYWDQQRKRHGV